MTRISSDPGFYQDLNELQQIKSNPDQRAALDAAAGQFEVSFLQTVLKHMRSATDALQDEDDDLVGRLEMTANNRTPAFTIGIPTQDVN